MNAAGVLGELLDRVVAGRGEGVIFSEHDLAGWPVASVHLLKAAGLLTRGSPANGVVCPGCEEACTMPVEVATMPSGEVRAFVMCDKRDDTGRVPIDRGQLERWTSSPAHIAATIARLLDIPYGESDAGRARWHLGILRGARHAAHVVLTIEGGLRLSLAGHAVPVEDVLELRDQGLVIDHRRLQQCVDAPAGPGGDTESREQRIARLRRRRDELKKKGVRGFIKRLAAEENCSTSLIKQLLGEKKPANPWAGLLPGSARAVPKKKKSSR